MSKAERASMRKSPIKHADFPEDYSSNEQANPFQEPKNSIINKSIVKIEKGRLNDIKPSL